MVADCHVVDIRTKATIRLPAVLLDVNGKDNDPTPVPSIELVCTLIMDGGAGTKRLKNRYDVCDAASVTETVKVYWPDGIVGVPEMTPVEESRVRPRGRKNGGASHEYGVVPPLAASCARYGVFNC